VHTGVMIVVQIGDAVGANTGNHAERVHAGEPQGEQQSNANNQISRAGTHSKVLYTFKEK